MIRPLAIAVALIVGFGAGWLGRGALSADVDAQDVTMGAGERLPALDPAPGPTGTDPRLERFSTALVASDHDLALRIYEDVADPGREPTLTRALRVRMFEPLERIGAGSGSLQAAISFLEAFTWLYPRDAEALAALARGQERVGRLREAARSWWAVATAEGGGEGAERARRRARVLVESVADGARARDDAAALVALYREALREDPSTHRFRILLADVLDAEGDHLGALEVLDAIPVGVLDDRSLARTRALVEQSARLAVQYPEGLPLRAHGDHFVVSVETADGESLELLLDTGATLTVLKPGAIGRIAGARPEARTIALGTAGGVVHAPLYRVDGLRLGPLDVGDLRVAVMDLEGMEAIDGLLGMDQLSRFDFRIDPVAGRLLLARRAP